MEKITVPEQFKPQGTAMRNLFAAAVRAAKELLASAPHFTVEYQDEDGIAYMGLPASSKDHAKQLMMKITQDDKGIHILRIFAPGEAITPKTAAKDEYFSGGFDIMKKLQKKLVKEQKGKESWTNPNLEKSFDKMSLPKGTVWFRPKTKISDPNEPALKSGDQYQEWNGTKWVSRTYK